MISEKGEAECVLLTILFLHVEFLPHPKIIVHKKTKQNIPLVKQIEMVGHQKMEVLLLNGAIFGVSKSGQKHLKSL